MVEINGCDLVVKIGEFRASEASPQGDRDGGVAVVT